jgi:hypothetical protein
MSHNVKHRHKHYDTWYFGTVTFFLAVARLSLDDNCNNDLLTFNVISSDDSTLIFQRTNDRNTGPSTENVMSAKLIMKSTITVTIFYMI